ncbi:MAG: RNase adapter RapZ [Parasphingorhabdus sp.]|nr:RNase adapter RapZ [Parasphingorhabdus sp.]
MTQFTEPKPILLVTGLSGAGKSTALKTLEDIGWETIDNFPIRLIESLIATPPSKSQGQVDPPLAVGFDSRTRGFRPDLLINRIKKMQASGNYRISMLFLDCTGEELERRYAETRRRHPLAPDRPAKDGIALERSQLEPLRRWAEHVIDTSDLTSNSLQQRIRQEFDFADAHDLTLTLTSFGFSRGLPNNIDLLFDVRFLDNPYWVEDLRLLTGQDQAVADHVSSDPAFAEAIMKFTDLLTFLLPRYEAAGKAYINVGIGCTGGRHRSVHVAERLAKDLQDAGFSPTVLHRDLNSRPMEALEVMQRVKTAKGH